MALPIDIHVPKIDLKAIENTLFQQMMSKVQFPIVPQGLSGLINVQEFNAKIEEIENATCGELQKVIAEAMGSLQAQVGAITDQLTFLAPIVALIEGGISNPVAWILKFIEVFLGPYAKAYIVYIAQLTQLAQQMVALAQHIEAALQNLATCAVSFPGLTIPIPGGSPIIVPPIIGGIGIPGIPGVPPGGPIGVPIPKGYGSGPSVTNLIPSGLLPTGFNLQWNAPR